MNNRLFTAFANLFLTIISVLVKPFVHFAIGYVVGCFIQLILGDIIIIWLSWFHILIEPSQIPLLFAVLALIASFFKTTDTFYIEDEEE